MAAMISSCRFRSVAAATVVLLAVAGCIRISVDPTCPEELAIGQSGPVAANETNPGAIATYFWEVSPSQAGTFADPELPSTTFEALAAGNAVIRLTASDGLFMDVAECRTLIKPPALVVSLTAVPAAPVVGETVTLTCTVAGEPQTATYEIEQQEGEAVDLTPVSDGVVSFSADAVGEAIFACVGVDENGGRSAPAVVTVSIGEGPVDTDGREDDGGDRPSGRG